MDIYLFIGLIIAAGILLHVLHKKGVMRVKVPFAIDPVAIFYDVKLWFSKAGRSEIYRERHNLHFRDSWYVILFIWAAWAFDSYFGDILQIRTMSTGWIIFLSGFACLIVHAIREERKRQKGGTYPDNPSIYGIQAGKDIVKFSWRDVRYGQYGGYFWGAVAVGTIHLILELLNHIL